MGYYVDKTESHLIFKDGLDLDGAVLQAVKERLFDPEYFAKMANGGQWPQTGDLFADKWYAWTDTKACREATTLKDLLKEFLDEVYAVGPKELEFDYNTKSGNERELFEALAPFFEAGSYIAWRGEDGEHWRWDFDGVGMTERMGRVVYDD